MFIINTTMFISLKRFSYTSIKWGVFLFLKARSNLKYFKIPLKVFCTDGLNQWSLIFLSHVPGKMGRGVGGALTSFYLRVWCMYVWVHMHMCVFCIVYAYMYVCICVYTKIDIKQLA